MQYVDRQDLEHEMGRSLSRVERLLHLIPHDLDELMIHSLQLKTRYLQATKIIPSSVAGSDMPINKETKVFLFKILFEICTSHSPYLY